MRHNESIGVLVGSDASQEWLLPWFYVHFRKYNPDCPIVFADFGMSSEARNWCEERGSLQSVPAISIESAEKPGVLFQGEFWQEWKLDISSWAPGRLVCFRKPLALAESPFKRTLWLDLDCQVRGDLESLFAMALSSDGLAAAPCGSFCHVNNLSRKRVFLIDKYNTGVILTEKASPILEQWVSLIEGRVSFLTDEGSLSFLVDRKEMQITEIPYLYNWPVHAWGENEEALIYHWLGREAKCRLRTLVACK